MSAGGVERTEQIIDRVRAEITRSIAKHGDQSHLPTGTGPTTTPLGLVAMVATPASTLAMVAQGVTDYRASKGLMTWWDILLEEVLEAAEEDHPGVLASELVQVPAVAIKWAEALERKQGGR